MTAAPNTTEQSESSVEAFLRRVESDTLPETHKRLLRAARESDADSALQLVLSTIAREIVSEA
jgi:hypothetical protein